MKKHLWSVLVGAALALGPIGQPALAQEKPQEAADKYMTVVLMRAKTLQRGSIYRFYFLREPKYEGLVRAMVAKAGPPSGFLGRQLCGNLDPIACGLARPDRGPSHTVDIIYEGEPEQALPLLKDFYQHCNKSFFENPCAIYGEFLGARDERALEVIPPGAKRVMVARGTTGEGEVGPYGFGAALTLCYEGPCTDRSAMLDELFWNGVVPMLNTVWISPEHRRVHASQEVDK